MALTLGLLLNLLLSSVSFAEEVILIPVSFNEDQKENLSLKSDIIENEQIFYLPKSFLLNKEKSLNLRFPDDIIKSNEEFVSTLKLKKHGFYVFFDEAKVELTIISPTDKNNTKKLSVINRTTQTPEGKKLKEEAYSGYVNTSLSSGFKRDYFGFSGRDPVRARFDGVLNANSFILEASGQFEEEKDFRREDVRLVKETNLLNGSRFSVGDLYFPVKGYQGYRRLGGISFYTTRQEKRGLLSSQASGRLLEIKQPSTITFYVNELPITSKKVLPGFYDLSDLPLSVGLNQVRVLIEAEGSGEKEQIIFDEFFSDYGLNKGQMDLSVALGDKAIDYKEKRQYNSDHRTFMLNSRYDLTNSYSLSEYLQLDQSYKLLGLIQALHLTPGFLEMDIAGSREESRGGIATRLSFFKTAKSEYSFLKGDCYTVSFDRKFKGFKVIDQNESTGSTSFSTSYHFPKKDKLSLSLNYLRRSLDIGGLSQNYSVKTDYPLGQVFLSFLLQKTTLDRAPDDLMVGLTLTYSPKERNYYLNSQLSEKGIKRNQLSISSSKDQDIHGSITELENLNSHQYSTKITGVTNRAEFTFSGDHTETKHNYRYLEQFQLNTRFALAFAGNKTAIGRPISDSFLITDSIDQSRRYRLETWGRYSESGPMGEALLDFNNYQLNSVRASSNDLYDVGYRSFEKYYTQNSYKNGYIVTLNEKIAPTVISLKTENVEAYKLLELKLINVKTKEEVSSIVSSDGEIFLEEIDVGRYQYILGDKSGYLTLDALGGRKELEF